MIALWPADMLVSALNRLPTPLLRVSAWLCVALLGVLSWLPASKMGTRPAESIGMPGSIEHLFAYFGTAAVLTLAYPDTPRRRLLGGLIAYAAVLEAGQLYVPHRAAQVVDWAASALGAVLGVLAITHLTRKPVHCDVPKRTAMWLAVFALVLSEASSEARAQSVPQTAAGSAPPTDHQKREFNRSYVQAATDCLARAISADSLAMGHALGERWSEAVAETGATCREPLARMVAQHDRLYGEGTVTCSSKVRSRPRCTSSARKRTKAVRSGVGA
jgi:VanZ family protein